MKRILGLDLGTNSIGWALVASDENDKLQKIEGMGSRIIPMSQDVLGKFDSGVSVSQTAERTNYRGVRRLRERHLLRRERLLRVLNIMNFLPEHFQKEIDFERSPGKFLSETEPKIAWKKHINGKYEFVFKDAFNEMLVDFKRQQPQLFENDCLIPYDWTIYFLRKKALSEKIHKHELAWLLLNFNQKRGYYQLRGEDDEETTKTAKTRKYFEKETIINIIDYGKIYKGLKVLIVELSNGNKGKIFKKEIPNWIGLEKNIIATVDIDKDGKDKIDEDGLLSQRFAIPSDAEWETEWKLIKIKTEKELNESQKTVGNYIYDTLLNKPAQKINGKLVRTIERKFYKEELKAILEKQKELHCELKNTNLFFECLNELYPNNESHKDILNKSGFVKLFLDDIIFYQRPLKSKKSLISNCPYEYYTYKKDDGSEAKPYIKCISKSHPLFQEFRLWQFIHNLRIYKREDYIDGKLKTDIEVTNAFFKTDDDYTKLFDWLNERKEIKQDILLSFFNIKKEKGKELAPYRWNYVEDKIYPCNETHYLILKALEKVIDIQNGFLTKENELALWHILYSVEDKKEIEKALETFAQKHMLDYSFVEIFKKLPPFKKEYGSYSAKAIKKLLTLMRKGKYWEKACFDEKTLKRIENLLTGEYDESIDSRTRELITKYAEKNGHSLTETNHFQGLPLHLACYIVYGRHSEITDVKFWKTPDDIENYLKNEFKQHSLRNPIVEQIIAETLRVVKDIWKHYGSFSEIHIELGREMKNDKKARERISKQVTDNENTNLRIKAILMELKNFSDVENVRPYSPNQQEILKIYEEGVLNSDIIIPEDIAKISKLSQPTKSEIFKYKCWIEQKYRSPYTGETIPLSKLFTSDYQIEHIIPQSRYFDDSMSNKVICESVVNANPYKDNQLAYEFIKNNEGRIVDELSRNDKTVKIFTLKQYEDFVKEHFSKNPAKKNKLLMEDIPESFIERQLNDSRYISKVVKALLSNIVREENEVEAISKNVIPCTGSVTSILKQDWGLNDVWNNIIYPRFERLNQLTNSNFFGLWVNKDGKKFFQTEVPLQLQKGFSKKRIDHRHHALDALVIACASRSHVNYLNNESAKANAKETRYDLKNKLCFKAKTDDKGNYKWQFYKPWPTFTQDTQKALEDIVVSFKQNTRVINKTVNHYQKYINGKKVTERQVKGDNWAIRKPIHKETVAGIVNLKFKKTVQFSAAIDKWEMLVDKNLKRKIKQLLNEGLDKRKITKFFSELDYKWMTKDVAKPEIYYFSDEAEVMVASRTHLDSTFNEKKIASITDKGIQKILLNHLKSEKYQNQLDEKENSIAPEFLAFSPEGIDDLNKNIITLNNGKHHKPILKVRTYEPKGNKFNVGYKGNKKQKFVEAATGTNLYFAIYVNEEGKRSFETIPLNIVIERLKQGLKEVPEANEKGHKLLFFLSPNDLVYVKKNDDDAFMYNVNIKDIDKKRVYKMVSSTKNECHFIPTYVSSLILSYDSKTKIGEFGSLNKSEKTIDGEMIIKNSCVKLSIDKLGNIKI